MSGFRDIPIKQKILVILMATAGTALVLTGISIVAADSLLFRASLHRDVAGLASIVGDYSATALILGDPEVGNRDLATLRARTPVIMACLYRGESVFARYARSGEAPPCPAPRQADQVTDTAQGLIAFHTVKVGGLKIGTLALLYDPVEAGQRDKLFGGIVAAILLLSSLLAFALSSRLRDIVAAPIARLAQAATAVSESGDYSIRVKRDTGDELGLLVDVFNRMLERVEARDREIQNARNSLETTLTSIGDGVISTDRNGRIVFANPVAQSLLGSPETEILGKAIDDVFRIVNEFSREPVETPVWRALREGRAVGLANNTLLVARDGREIPVDDSAAPIKQGGQTVGAVLVFRDVTERRKAQRDAAYLAAIVQSSDDAIVGKSPDGVIQSWNDGAEQLYGYKAEEVIGRPMLELLPPDRRHEELEILERIRAGIRVVHFETVRVRKDGTPRDVSITISPIRDKTGQIVGASHVARDITEQKRTAEQIQQTQKLESLGVLAGGIAHDFNNLLTGIMGNASIAAEELTAQHPAREPIEAVLSASERASQLARQMLAYSGKGHFVLEQIDLSQRIRETIPLIKGAIPSAIELRLELEDQLPAIEADTAQIQQLIMNVIINGAEAVPEGTRGMVTVRTRRREVDEEYLRSHIASSNQELKPGPYVLFEVSDTGSGMDRTTLARIFDPFFTTKFTGRGLGLAAVLGIVRGHHGSIEVQSAVGQGTVFRFLFPVAAAVRAQKAKPQPQALDRQGAGTVLVVDDEQVVREMASQALERYGYNPLAAEDGARALDIFHRHQDEIVCVVLDLTMPVMSGEEALARMKSLRPNVPVILSSGFNEAQAIERFQGKGLAGFLQKPYRA
ncbi:MAG: PAS domain S-box protein, partial [Acidobacteriia bacterium]|nr:PAS domain S-box protein [Terriglobia bacterium]